MIISHGIGLYSNRLFVRSEVLVCTKAIMEELNEITITRNVLLLRDWVL